MEEERCTHRVDPVTGVHFWVEDCGRPDCGHRRDVPDCPLKPELEC